MSVQESEPRSPTLEELCRLIHNRFDQRSVETGWAATAELMAWDEEHESIPPSYKEALRLTVDDLFDSDWMRDLLRQAVMLAYESAAKDWEEGKHTTHIITVNSARYMHEGDVPLFLRSLVEEVRNS